MLTTPRVPRWPIAQRTRPGQSPRPAHEGAPERLRASALTRPFIPELERPGLERDVFEGLFAKLLRRVGR
jgi:hypothetical protein